MKKISLISLLSFVFCLQAQQWISQKYAYDSLLNVTYGSSINFMGGQDTLTMDIYLPKCAQSGTKKPLLMWIHGGAFLAGDKNELTYFCKNFAKRGYVTATINYRLGFVADDNSWSCNYPNYPCAFASDSAEWYRAYYRATQDAKGALRFLINRNSQYGIDTNNVFVAGESAGAFIALGVSLLDTASERLPASFALVDAPKPNTDAQSCSYNINKVFVNATIARPDLGGIDGLIEPTLIHYKLKGIGNMFGGMISDLLKNSPAHKMKPAIFSYHQPCDLVVPFDSGNVFSGLSWCMTNGYGCYGFANTGKVFGSKALSNWNTQNSYGYSIHNEFTNTQFPYSFLLGTASCADQINSPCHGYDNVVLREKNLATFFASLITTSSFCDSSQSTSIVESQSENNFLKLQPNPCTNELKITVSNFEKTSFSLVNVAGETVVPNQKCKQEITQISMEHLPANVYFLIFQQENGFKETRKIIKF